MWNLITLEKKKRERINPWWKKSSGSSDFHQNAFAREKTLVRVNQSWKLARQISQWEVEQKVLEGGKQNTGNRFRSCNEHWIHRKVESMGRADWQCDS